MFYRLGVQPDSPGGLEPRWTLNGASSTELTDHAVLPPILFDRPKSEAV